MAIIGISGKIGSGKDTVGSIIRYLTTVKEYQNYNSYKKFFEHCKPNGGFAESTHIWKVKKFAYKLKQIVSILTGCSIEDLESQEFKSKNLDEIWNYYTTFQPTSEGTAFIRSTPTEEAKKMLPYPNRIKPFTYREMLQRVGTEAMRNNIHEDVWINALFSEYKPDGYRDKGGTSLEAKFVKGKIEEIKGNIEYIYPNWIITDMRFPNEMRAVERKDGITIRLQRGIETNEGHPSETALDLFQFDYVVTNNGTIEELVEKVKEILIKEKII